MALSSHHALQQGIWARGCAHSISQVAASMHRQRLRTQHIQFMLSAEAVPTACIGSTTYVKQRL